MSFDADAALALLESHGIRHEDVMAEYNRRLEAKYRRAMKLQVMAAKTGGVRRRLRGKDLDGYVGFQIRPEFFHYWGSRLGYECWKDKGFVEEFLRDNPECRVKTEEGSPVITAGALFDASGARVA